MRDFPREFRGFGSRLPLHIARRAWSSLTGLREKTPDLLIAAVAARNGLTLVHHDGDYEIIASVTGQATRWAARRGTV